MYLLELDQRGIEKCLLNNRLVLISVYQNDCLISEMMEGVLAHVCKQIDNRKFHDVVIATAKKEYLDHYLEGNLPSITPELILFQDQKIVDRLPGFRRVSQIVDFVSEYLN